MKGTTVEQAGLQTPTQNDPEYQEGQRKVYAEDIVVGRVIDLGSYVISEREIIDFATAWDPYPFHIDREAAEKGYFGGIIASGIQTMAIYQRLSTLGPFRNWAVIAGRGIDSLQLRAPVRPDDTLTGQTTIVDLEFKRKSRALVSIGGSLRNQDGVEVLSLKMTSLVATREPHHVQIPGA